MKITLVPQFRCDTLTISKHGDVLTINGTPYDFSVIPDGATLPADAVDCEYVMRDIERFDGVLHLTVLLPIQDDASQAACFPDPLINPPDGVLELPQ